MHSNMKGFKQSIPIYIQSDNERSIKYWRAKSMYGRRNYVHAPF